MNWSDEDVKAFVSEQLNHYGYEVSTEETKQATSTWKQWIWLEKHGFDFAYDSNAAEIFALRMREDPCGVRPNEERRLLRQVRPNV